MEIFLNLSDLIPVTVYSRLDAVQSNGNSSDHLRFLFYQFYFHQFCLHSSTSTTLTQNDLLESLRPYYSSNRHVSQIVDQFNEEYNPSTNVFHWFSNEYFLRRILSQSLLRLNIPMLFALRFFIRDLFKSMLNQESTTTSSSYPGRLNSYLNGSTRYLNGRTSNEQIFYRGQALGKETFLKNQIKCW